MSCSMFGEKSNCRPPHYKVDCPEIDEAAREKLMERQQKRKKYYSAERMLSVDPYGPVAWLNGLMKLPYCADSGPAALETSQY